MSTWNDWSGSTAATASDAPNRYGVAVRSEPGGWRVDILDPAGRPVASRPCRGEAEARTYASTVRQHVRWLSQAKFREYYRLAAEEG